MNYIEIMLNLYNIPNYDIKSSLKGFYIRFNKEIYLISLHHGLPVKSILVDNQKINTFTKCNWNELLIKKYEFDIKDQLVFTTFFKKQVDFGKKFYINSKDSLKFLENSYFPLNMLPNNPKNLYYKMEALTSLEEGDSGKPVYDKNKNLIGILAKIEGNFVYVIPTIYILKSIEKVDNSNLYSVKDLNLIKKVNHSIIKNKCIYYSNFKSTIYLETYLLLEGDKNKKITLLKNTGTIERKNYDIINNNIENKLIFHVVNLKIKCNSSLLLYLKILKPEIFRDNLINIFQKRPFEINLDKTYSVFF